MKLTNKHLAICTKYVKELECKGDDRFQSWVYVGATLTGNSKGILCPELNFMDAIMDCERRIKNGNKKEVEEAEYMLEFLRKFLKK